MDFAPPACWAGVIVVLTSVPGRDVPDVGVPHIDKLVHFVLYAVLGVLLARAIVAIALFAAADEWHQRWVPGRSTDLLDWCADVAGGTLALLLAARPIARPEHLT
jgi:VanZ family protein